MFTKRAFKKTISLILAFAVIFSTLAMSSLSVSAANTTAFSKITSSNYAKTYTLSNSGRTTPYTTSSLTYRGSETYGKSSTAYIDNAADELYVLKVGQNSSGIWYAKVSYPVSNNKRAVAYIPLSAISKNNCGSSSAVTATGKFYCAPRKTSSTSSSYYVNKGEGVYLIATDGDKYQIMYPNSSGKYRIAWCSKSNYNKYCATSNSSVSSSSFSPVWPCKNSNYISTMYRYYNSGKPSDHWVRSSKYNAFDIAGSSGDTIYAIEKGIVVEKGYKSNGFGNYVVVKHENGLYSLYGHMKSAAKVNKGDTVSRKQVIGYMGTTGKSSGPHLHLEVYDPNNKSRVINPWVTYYQGKVSVTIGGNSYKANIKYSSDSRAQAWCRWLNNNCKKKSNGDYVFTV